MGAYSFVNHMSICPGDLAALLNRQHVTLPPICVDRPDGPISVVPHVVYDVDTDGTGEPTGDVTIISTIYIGPDGTTVPGPVTPLDSAACCC